MTYLNTYKVSEKVPLPRQVHLSTPPEEYDYNFCFEVKKLASDRVELRPFVPSLHARPLWDAISTSSPALLRWLRPFNDFDDFLEWAETTIRAQPGFLGYAIFSAPPGAEGPTDPKDFQLAGHAALINSSAELMTSECGWMIILEPFQRTHVLTHTAGLLIHRVLDMPSEGGLGLRRCQWFANNLNEKSRQAAGRLGFKEDGVIRAHRVLPKGMQGSTPGRKGDAQEENMSRDSWLASVTWYDWEGGVREHVDQLMARRK
ncbi:hypothetical protein IAU60_002848 [Kwoniella sp. DSM 27419]